MKSSSETDRAYFEQGVEELERYLLSDELYWPTHSPTSDLTQLTLGGLLLVRARLRGWNTGGLENPDFQFTRIRSEWASAWDGKSRREVHARGELWRQFLSGYSNDPRGTARLYAQNVRQRAILTLLGEPTEAMDGFLKTIFRPGGFFWDEQLQGGFPQSDFWFLYGNLAPKE